MNLRKVALAAALVMRYSSTTPNAPVTKPKEEIAIDILSEKIPYIYGGGVYSGGSYEEIRAAMAKDDSLARANRRLHELQDSIINDLTYYPKNCADKNARPFRSDGEPGLLVRQWIAANFDRIYEEQRFRFAPSTKPTVVYDTSSNPPSTGWHQNDTIFIANSSGEKRGILTLEFTCKTPEAFETKLENMLRHEEFHHQMRAWFRQNKLTDWIAPPGSKKERRMPYMILNEGIVTYLGIHALPLEKQAPEREYARLPESQFDSLLVEDPLIPSIWHLTDYHGIGYTLVEPILDKYGDEGAKYLYKHPLKFADLTGMRGYRTRMLKQLDAKSKQKK